MSHPSRGRRVVVFIAAVVVVLALATTPVQAARSNDAVPRAAVDADSALVGWTVSAVTDNGTAAVTATDKAPTGTADDRVHHAALDTPGSVARLVAMAQTIKKSGGRE